MRTDDLDIHLLHGPSKLGQGICCACSRLVDPEDAMFVAIEGGWLAVTGEIAFCRLAVAEKALAFHEEQLPQSASRIIDEHQQSTSRSTPFKPVMRRTIDLHQLSKTGSPFSHLVGHYFAGFPGLPQPFRDHHLAHTLIADLHPFDLHQLLTSQRWSKSLVSALQQVENPLTLCFRDAVVAWLSTSFRDQSPGTIQTVCMQ